MRAYSGLFPASALLVALSLAISCAARGEAPMAAGDSQVVEGRALFETYCVECHGAEAREGPGGDIRGLPVEIVARATRGLEQMPEIELTKAELAAIVAYLEHLSSP